MEKPESKQYRKELAEEVSIMRESSPEAAKAILDDQKVSPEYKEAEVIHRNEQREVFQMRKDLEIKRQEIEDLKKKLNELEGGILSEDQIWGLEILRKKYEHLVYRLYVNDSDSIQDIALQIPEEHVESYLSSAPHRTPYQEEVEKKQKPIIANPAKQDFGKLSVEVKKENKGRYTLNPFAQEIDLDQLPIEKIELVTLNDTHHIHEALTKAVKDYGNEYVLPGIELLEHLMKVDADGRLVKQEMLDRLTADLSRETAFCFFPGSLVCRDSGWTAISLSRGEDGKWNNFGTQLLSSPYISEISIVVLIKK